MNDRSLGVLSDRQDHAIIPLRRLPVLMISMAVLLAIGVLVIRAMGGMMLRGCGKLLEEMVHPVRRGRGQKKPQGGGNAQE